MKGRRLVVLVAVVGILIAVAVPAFAGNITKQKAPASAQGKRCGTINLAVNNWVGYEADAFVVGAGGPEAARLPGQLRLRRRADLLAGLRQRAAWTPSWRTGVTTT